MGNVRYFPLARVGAFLIASAGCSQMLMTPATGAERADAAGHSVLLFSPARMSAPDSRSASAHSQRSTADPPSSFDSAARKLAEQAYAWVPKTERFYDPYAYEVRVGFQVEARSSNEQGTVDVGGDLIFPRFFTLTALPDYITPRFQIGGMINTAGRTDFLHTDMLWTYNFTERFFTDFFFGATIHDGHLDHDSDKYNALGCRVLFHVGGDFGYRFTPHWSAMVVLDHSSSGNGLTGCPSNQSLNQVGMKVGYRF